MSQPAQRELSPDEVIRLDPHQRKGIDRMRSIVRLMPPAGDQSALRAWALSIAAAADRRVAELEARLAHLESVAVTDELTGALNRRGFVIEFSRAIDAARRRGLKGVVLICDLDGFKLVNDRLGHAFGDAVLRRVGGLLLRGVRRMDAVARLGGDEFAILLIGADLESAQRRAQSFARGIAALAPRINSLTIPLSASFGLAAYDGSEDEETVLNRADLTMYAAKRRASDTTRSTCAGMLPAVAGAVAAAARA
ncbi:MAG TPA: GGDEF domain-containing protein [Stellaceae bacterium]|nr:GGDEF domain-containing protein [Stellaceae bacterium]